MISTAWASFADQGWCRWLCAPQQNSGHWCASLRCPATSRTEIGRAHATLDLELSSGGGDGSLPGTQPALLTIQIACLQSKPATCFRTAARPPAGQLCPAWDPHCHFQFFDPSTLPELGRASFPPALRDPLSDFQFFDPLETPNRPVFNFPTGFRLTC